MFPQQRTKGSHQSLRKGQAVELRAVDSSQVGATLQVVVDVQAVEHQVAGLNQAVDQLQVANHLVHLLRRTGQRKHRGISDKDALVPHILGREIGSDRSSNRL